MGSVSGSDDAVAREQRRGAGYRLFHADDSAARNFMVVSALWLVFGTAMGLLLAIEFVFPDFMSWLPFVFSRLRQEHTNTVMFGFLSTGMIGLWYYILPRLTGRRLWSEPLANVVLVLWTVGVLIGVVLISMAHTQSREYAEMVWGVDIAILVALVLSLVIVFMTIARRVESKLYVTLWFIIGTSMWMPLLYAIGNVVWNPPTGALTGINDAIWNWFYGHNVLGLWFTTGMLGVFYYLLPKEVHTPLYSVKLGLISFWGTLLFYTGVGGHHLLWAPIPGWLKVTAVAESIGMILPVTAFFINTVMTMRGNWSRFFSNVSLRFTLLGGDRLHHRLVPGLADRAVRHELGGALHAVRPGAFAPRPAVLLRVDRDRRHLLRAAADPQLRALRTPPGRASSGCSSSSASRSSSSASRWRASSRDRTG